MNPVYFGHIHSHTLSLLQLLDLPRYVSLLILNLTFFFSNPLSATSATCMCVSVGPSTEAWGSYHYQRYTSKEKRFSLHSQQPLTKD